MPNLSWSLRGRLWLLRAARQRARERFESQVREASRVNARTLRALLHHNRDTVFGRRHAFASLRSVAEYQRALPLSDYAFFLPEVERIARGEQRVLSADKVEYLGRTSGTTGTLKLHPLTRAGLRQLSQISLLGRSMVAERLPTLRPARDMLLMNGRLSAPSEGGLKTGSLTALSVDLIRRSPAASLLASPPFVFTVNKHADAIYLHLLFGLRERELGSLQATFASGLLDMVHTLERRGPELLEDLGRGGVRPDIELTAEERLLAQKHLRPEPARARELETVLAGGRRGLAKRIWPRLSYVSGIAGASFSLYAQQLEPFREGVAFHHASYVSTEALLGVALELERPHYCLLPGMSFLEFIPEEQLEEAQPRVLLPEELLRGQAYEVVLTTVNGMYRYRLGDVVRVVGHYQEAPVVEVLYRRGTLLNMIGEKTSEHATRHALEQVLRAQGAHLADYSVVERTETLPGSYGFFVELQDTRAAPVEAELGTALDAALCQANPFYAQMRGGGKLGPPLLELVRPGAFQAVRDVLVRRGGSSTQVKVPRVVRDAELKALLQERRVSRPT
jgi:hypothetical protein